MGDEGTDKQLEGLGFDPRETSDCSVPPNFNLNTKRELLEWRHSKHGKRLFSEIQRIPHVTEYSVDPANFKSDESIKEFTKHLAGDARQVMFEYIYAKQYYDVLRQERDLVKWHLANSQKTLQSKLLKSLFWSLKRKLVLIGVAKRKTRFEVERIKLSADYKRSEEVLKMLLQSYKQTQDELEFWLARRGDYLSETIMERRQANHERKLRSRQYRKLNQAVALDKKWHVNISSLVDLDNKVYETYKDASNYREKEFRQIEFITHPIRAKLIQETQKLDPLEDYSND